MGLTMSLWSSGKDTFYGRHEVEHFRGLANAISKPNCDKVNGCSDMIPVYDFTRDHLPDPYNKIKDVYELTQALAYLTVRLKCQYISEKRPRYIPGTEQDDYPLHDLRGKWEPTTGTGRVCDVVKYTLGKCTCAKCILSQTPSTVWWEIEIFTATHVVYDELEAKKTTCSFFYDWEYNEERVDIASCQQKWLLVGGDLCLLYAVTCDEVLATKLFNKIQEFNTYWKSLKVMYEKDKRKEQLVIIVSHPHGKAKRISVGRGVDVGILHNLGYNKYIYTTPTCPGTSGGPVYVLGCDLFSMEFVHGGTLLSNGAIFSETSSIGLESVSEYFSSSENGVLTISFSSRYKTEQTEANKSNTPLTLDQIVTKNSDHDMNTQSTIESKSVNKSVDSIMCRFSNYSGRWY